MLLFFFQSPQPTRGGAAREEGKDSVRSTALTRWSTRCGAHGAQREAQPDPQVLVRVMHRVGERAKDAELLQPQRHACGCEGTPRSVMPRVRGPQSRFEFGWRIGAHAR